MIVVLSVHFFYFVMSYKLRFVYTISNTRCTSFLISIDRCTLLGYFFIDKNMVTYGNSSIYLTETSESYPESEIDLKNIDSNWKVNRSTN